MSTILGDLVEFSHSSGGCTLNDPTLVDWAGAIKVCIDNIDGWRETVDLNVSRVQRGVGDGDYVASRFAKKSRVLIIEGYILAPDRASTDELFDALVNNAFPEDTDITITRHEPVPKYVVGRLAGPIEDTQYIPGGMRWSTTILCPDPLKYDALNVISGSSGVSGISSGGRTYPRTYPLSYNLVAGGEGNQITVYNAGTARTPPIIVVTGPLPAGWRIESVTTGETSSFDVDLSALDELEIDMGLKTAKLNGEPINGLLVGGWLTLVPKTNVLRLYGNYDPAAQISLTAKSAWR